MLNVFKKSKKHKVHFLHIGKTGGSAIKHVLKKHLETPKYIIELHGHGTSLKDIPKGEYVVFFLRDPVSRFISAFYSRQRKGQPRYYSEWSDQDKEVFEIFKTPNNMACSLADQNSKQHSLSIKAMKSIQHFTPYKKWYIDFEYFNSRIEDVLYIGFQESLTTDFAELVNTLELPQSVAILPTDDIAAHKNPKDLDKVIDKNGVLALRDWYSDDIKFISLCKRAMSNKRVNADSPEIDKSDKRGPFF